MNFGPHADFIVGAYAAAILIVKAGWPWLLASLAGGVMAVGGVAAAVSDATS